MLTPTISMLRLSHVSTDMGMQYYFSKKCHFPVLILMEAKDKLQANINNSFIIMWDCSVGSVLSSVTSPCTPILNDVDYIIIHLTVVVFCENENKGIK